MHHMRTTVQHTSSPELNRRVIPIWKRMTHVDALSPSPCYILKTASHRHPSNSDLSIQIPVRPVFEVYDEITRIKI